MEFVILPALLLVMYLLVLRPQQKRLKAQRALVASLQVGDEVISSAGIHGRVVALSDDVATLEVAPGVELRFARSAMAERTATGAEVWERSRDEAAGNDRTAADGAPAGEDVPAGDDDSRRSGTGEDAA